MLIFIYSALLSFVLTPLVIKIAYRFRLVDDPRKRSHPAQTHRGVIPRAGGLGIGITIIGMSLLFLPMSKLLVGILLGCVGFIVIGILDDYYDLSPGIRLVANIFIAQMVVLFGLGIPYVTNPIGGVIRLDEYRIIISFFGEHSFLVLANIFAIIWISAFANFTSWSKGVDGQLPGFVAVACVFIGLFALRFSSHDISALTVSLLAFIIGGAYAGFLPWNFYPQKIMPGYSGGSLAGYFLAVLSILSYSKLGMLVMVLAVPLVDAMYTMIRRVLKGNSPLRGDAGHFHHRLLSIGWGRRRIAVFYWLTTFIFGICALYFAGVQKMLALLTTILLLALFMWMIEAMKISMRGIKKR